MKTKIKLIDPKFCGHLYESNYCPLLDQDNNCLSLKPFCRLGYKLNLEYDKEGHVKKTKRPSQCIEENGN